MEAIILAGGRGTRLNHLTDETPKPLISVKGRPFLDHVLDYLERYGVSNVVLSVGYLAEQFRARYGAEYRSMKISYAVETEPKGTGGAIRLALDFVSDSDPLILNGDTLFRVDLKILHEFHLAQKSTLTLALRPMESASRYGKVKLKGRRVEGFEEKGSLGAGLINGGIYVVNKAALLGILPDQDAFSFERDFLEPKVKEIRPAGISFDSYFIDIGIPEDLERAERDLPVLPSK